MKPAPCKNLGHEEVKEFVPVEEKAVIVFVILHPRRHLGFMCLCSLTDVTIKGQPKLLRRPKKKKKNQSLGPNYHP